MNALTSPEITEIVVKVGRPRSTDNGKIALDVERIRAMRAAGFSVRQIADYLNVGVSTVRRRLAEAEGRRYRAAESRKLPDPDLSWLKFWPPPQS